MAFQINNQGQASRLDDNIIAIGRNLFDEEEWNWLITQILEQEYIKTPDPEIIPHINQD